MQNWTLSQKKAENIKYGDNILMIDEDNHCTLCKVVSTEIKHGEVKLTVNADDNIYTFDKGTLLFVVKDMTLLIELGLFMLGLLSVLTIISIYAR
jgi:hypothetical protein